MDNTILYISSRANSGDSVLDALKEKGYEVVTASSPTEAVALLYVFPPIVAVVLDKRAREQVGFDVAQSLKQIRPNIPVVELCSDQTEGSRSRTNKCVSTDKIASALKYLLAAESVA